MYLVTTKAKIKQKTSKWHWTRHSENSKWNHERMNGSSPNFQTTVEEYNLQNDTKTSVTS